MSEILTGTPSGGRPETSPTTNKVIHPVRGVLWGLLFGLGLAGLLVSLKVVSLSMVTLILLVLVGIVSGALWSTLGPARAPSGPAPERHARPQPPEVSRLDDFTDPPPPTV